MTEKRKREPLNAFVILIIIMAFCAMLTWVIPAGSFERTVDPDTGEEIVVPGTYRETESTPVGPVELVQSIYEGFVDASDIIFFIVFASSFTYMLNKTGAIDAVCGVLLRRLGNREHMLIPIFMFVFGLAGTAFGMYEEVYSLVPVFIIIAISLGFDRVVGGAIVLVGVATGFAAATINPFTIGVAAGVAKVPLAEPKVLIFRIICFVLFESLAIAYTMRYAAKIKKDPSKSIMYGLEQAEFAKSRDKDEILSVKFSPRHKISMIGLGLLIIILVYGVIKEGWWFEEIASLFLVFFVITGFVNGYGPNEIGSMFVESAKSTIYGALLVGMARGIAVVLNSGGITDTIVNFFGSNISGLPPVFTAIGMLIVQNLINFFIPSGSGQAVVTMPIMAPLADVTGLSRQLACVAFQFGDGFSNMFWPTGCAELCGFMGLSLGQWYKFITKLFGMMFCLQCIMLMIAVAIGV